MIVPAYLENSDKRIEDLAKPCAANALGAILEEERETDDAHSRLRTMCDGLTQIDKTFVPDRHSDDKLRRFGRVEPIAARIVHDAPVNEYARKHVRASA